MKEIEIVQNLLQNRVQYMEGSFKDSNVPATISDTVKGTWQKVRL